MTISKYYLSAFFLFIMIIVVPLHIFLSPFNKDGKVEIVREVYSPDEQFKVVEYLYMGGGTLGFCKRNLSVQNHDQHIPTINDFPTNIFSASCRVDVSIVWLNNEELKIKYVTKELVEPNVVLNPNTNLTYEQISIEYESDI